MAIVWTTVQPVRIIRNTRHADEKIYVTHDLGKNQRRDRIESERFDFCVQAGRVNRVETNLIG